MRFLIDESVDFQLVAHLRSRGHDVTAIAHDHPAALADRRVLDLAVSDERILVTNDTDFRELVVRQGLPHAGIVLFRLQSETLSVKCEAIDELVRNFDADLSAGAFLVVTDRGVRIRRPNRR